MNFVADYLPFTCIISLYFDDPAMGEMYMGDTVDAVTMGGMGGKDFLLNSVFLCL